MPIKVNKAANALQKIIRKRYSYQSIANWISENSDTTADRTHLFRIASGERNAKPELEKAIIQAAKVMK